MSAPTKAATRWVVVLTAIGSLMAAVDTVVSTALNTIRLDFGATVEQLEWTVNAYNLSFAVPLITGAALGVAPIAGALADRIGERSLMVGGLSLQAIAMAWLALIAEPGMAYTQVLGPFVVAGVGVSMAIPAAQSSVVGSVAMDAMGKAAGANSMMRELGGVFGIAAAVAVFAAAGSYASPTAFADGFTPAILVAAGLAAAGALVGQALAGRRPSGQPAPLFVVPALTDAA